MALTFQKEIRSFIESLPGYHLRQYTKISEEAYFYGLRNFAHFHGPRYINQFFKISTRRSLTNSVALSHTQYAPQGGWVSCVVETVEQAENTEATN